MSLPRFVVSPGALQGDSCVLTGDAFRHFRVRRLHAGSRVVVVDGAGLARDGIVTHVDRRTAVIQLSSPAPDHQESPLHLVLAQGLLKGDKLDLVVEKATELGVNEIRFFTSERTVSRATIERQDRWHRVARSAAQQSQRSTVPKIVGPVPLDEVLTSPTAGPRLFFWEDATGAGILKSNRTPPAASEVLVVVGPEGGFSTAEADRARHAGFHLIRLSRRILRAETAALVALTLAQFFWGDLAS